MSIKTYEERLVGLRPLQTYVPEHLLRAEIAELRAELERKNDYAERYQWLRSQHWDKAPFAVVANPKLAVKLGHNFPSLERLDAAIDAERIK